ncbi:MAG: DUF6512 family protein [Lachnospiraceae bacterium]
MNTALKRNLAAGAIFVSILGTILHFLYQWSGENFIVGLFAPVNESTWEHMKMLFFPMLLYILYMSFLFQKNESLRAVLIFALLTGLLLIPTLFYTYSGILGFQLIVIDIAIFYICVFFTFIFAHRMILHGRFHDGADILTLILLLTVVLFFVFSVYPPNLGIFQVP